ncbi:molybdate ABC transporter substrate-binding protein [Aliiroseovarius sp. S1339]|uniref:molybdate ABC transporter substrate-binding protein n=1 Tax=Aliiroseovarius sp. S1339 TaxID=2936990 RepID=UPI0020BF23FB|nr:molybdate ABC transporter substrate-binding protein [Aliiroseovarius sp. S1339]MCK8463025.1 molybdate ABC transporter substrate-binding protein [Aliiroseovarius sp. S1339]
MSFRTLSPVHRHTRSVVAQCVSIFPAAILAVCVIAPTAQAEPITVFAAASLKGALDEVVQDYKTQSGNDVQLSYAGSSVLARQISLGAPVDLFISANTDWMEVLDQGGHIASGTRVDLLGNTLVLIAPATATPPTPDELKDLAGYLDTRRFAMALVQAVPAGIYGKAALKHLGQWDDLAPLVAQTDNVRAALALVALGQTPLGVVYGSDAQAEPKVQVVMTFAPDSHPAIKYPAAIIANGNQLEAGAFLDWLQQNAAMQTFIDNGFTALEGS